MSEDKRNIPKLRFPGFTDAWEQRKLGELIEGKTILEQSDGNHGELYPRSEEFTEKGIPYIAASSISSDGESIDFNLTKYLPIERAKQFRKGVAKNGDILLAHNATVGPSVKLSMEYEFAILSTSLTLYRLNEERMDADFFLQAIRSSYFQNQLQVFMKQTTRSQVPILTQRNLMICFPENINEQLKIGKFLINLDNLIALHQRKCDEIKNLKKCMLQKMFPKEGEQIPEMRFPGFTDAWEQRKFGELLNETREKTTVEDEDTLLSCAIDGMFLNSELFSHFRGSSNIGYLKVKKNDLILSAQNLHLGNCNVNLRFEHGIISPAYKVYELINCNPLFMQAWVKQDKTKDFFLKAATEGASVCRKNIVWEDLYKQQLPVPEIDEQEKIGKFFQNLDNLITLHQRKLEQLKEMKKSLLQQMFV